MKEHNYWKIAFLILLLIIVGTIFWFVLNYQTGVAYSNGFEAGSAEVILMNSQNRFLVFNTNVNKTQEYTLGNLCQEVFGNG